MNDFFCRHAGALALLVMISGLLGTPIEAKPAKRLDIVDTVSANRILTKFAAMIQASDMVTFMSSRGPFTLFAPTDAAFDRLSPDQFAELLQPQNKERLQDILLFHLVNGQRIYAKDLMKLKTLPSCQGTPLTFRQNRLGTQLVLKAKIVDADIKCLNGVIHEVDTLLMPPESSLPPLLPAPAANTPPGSTNAPPSGETNSVSADTNARPSNPNAPPADSMSGAATNTSPSVPAAPPPSP